MLITIITLFPEVFDPILNSSILKRAQSKGKVSFKLVNLRDFGIGAHKVVDDRPYGGGVGMVLKPDVLTNALKSLALHLEGGKVKVVLMAASGGPFRQIKAREFSSLDHLVIICGHYEGVDQRFIEKYVDEEVSIGDYVLTGGEVPAMVLVDAVTRLIPGVLEKEEAIINESFTEDLLEHPHYTRPEVFEGDKVPEVLISGNHKKIEEWRKVESIKITKKQRPDLTK